MAWAWDFGGLGTSSDQNPSYTFQDDGVYTVCLTVTDDDGSTDTACHDVTVTDLGPTAAFDWAPDGQDEGAPIEFTGESHSAPDDIIKYEWDFGDAWTSDLESPSHTYADDGVYNVCLTVTDDDGSTDTACHDVTVENVAPTVTLIGPETADEGETHSYSYTLDATLARTRLS